MIPKNVFAYEGMPLWIVHGAPAERSLQDPGPASREGLNTIAAPSPSVLNLTQLFGAFKYFQGQLRCKICKHRGMDWILMRVSSLSRFLQPLPRPGRTQRQACIDPLDLTSSTGISATNRAGAAIKNKDLVAYKTFHFYVS